MTLLSRLFGSARDDRAALRPLWHRIVEIARERQWYETAGIADTVPGRFDAITLVLALVLLRMERDPELAEPSVRLTELFVEDMDGQLRQSGVGDPSVGKHMGTLMGTLGGRLGKLRELLPAGAEALEPFFERNMTLTETPDLALLSRKTVALSLQLDEASAQDILAARIGG